MNVRQVRFCMGKPGFLCFAIIAVTLAIHGPARADLVGYWAGNGNTLDNAGSHDGVLVNGATYGAGLVEQCFSLDGVDDYVAVPDAASNDVSNAEGTISAWVKPSAVGDNDIIIAFGSGAGGQGIGLGFWGSVRIYHHFGYYDWQTTTPVAANTWTLLTYTWDATKECVYVNGELKESRDRGDFSYVPGYARIGHGFWGDSANLFPGLIDEVRVYDNALSASEVAALVPEPSSLLLVGTGMLATAFYRLRRRMKRPLSE
ncbi:MAG: LamG-like jellyroll fold domain-containing protein [Thermoguttaceae bacterium]